jgi:hypothetical protein
MGGNRKLNAKILDATDGIGESRKRKRFLRFEGKVDGIPGIHTTPLFTPTSTLNSLNSSKN